MPTASHVRSALQENGNLEKAAFLPKFFKAGPGQYAEGDRFFCVSVPAQRLIARLHRDLPLPEIRNLLRDPFHECRLTALLILVGQFRRADPKRRSLISKFYLDNLDGVNNWDLVDSSAHHILGASLADKTDRSILYSLATSDHLWKQRVAIIATHHFIRQNDFADALALSEILLHHPHDLIHKAVGWTLREIGKRDPKSLTGFLTTHCRTMPRTALRYAIEKFTTAERAAYLTGKV